MEIRYLKPTDDRQAISKIYEESWKYTYKDIVLQEYLGGIPTGNWAQRIDADDRYTMVVTDGENIVGTSSFGRSRLAEIPDYGENIAIYFLPEYVGERTWETSTKRCIK